MQLKKADVCYHRGHQKEKAMYAIIRGMERRMEIRRTPWAIAVAAAAALCASAWGAAAPLPPLPDSPWADTEISTNVAFNAERSDAREFGVEMSFTGTASNCLQVAFGRDADGDGDLSPEETAMLLGWRAGSYFIEDAVGCVRYAEEAAVTGTALPDARLLSFRVALDGAFRPRAVAATNEAGACFPALAGSAPAWLYGADWNLMKLTRRGVDAVGETVSVECLYRFFRISIR